MGFLDRFRSRRADLPPTAGAVPPQAVVAPSVATVPAAASFSTRMLVGHPASAIPLTQLTFCVLDVETTGLDPSYDRIVELALMRLDHTGRVLGEMHTIVDPQQAVDATFVHGLSDADVRRAPTFDRLVPYVLAMVDGAVLVAHNASFDLSFLRAELARAGARHTELPYVCTMSLRRQVGLPGATAHRLSWACWQEGIAVELGHVAVCDARATGGLLARYLAHGAIAGMSSLGDLGAGGRAAGSWTAPLPSFPPAAAGPASVAPRSGVSPPGAWVVRTIAASDQAVRAYALQLAAAAEDFEIDEDEVAELSELVAELGLTPDQVRACHVGHLVALLNDRLDDGLLTWAEQQEVRSFARLLGVGHRDVEQLLARTEDLAEVEGRRSIVSGEALGVGLSVCFTGEFVAIPLTREEVWEVATDAGMVVSKGVTKKLDLLVCLEPGAGTGKLNKATDYGTVIIDQHTFLGLAGAQPAPDGVLRDVLDRLAQRRVVDADAADAKREAAAATARARNRERAQQRRAAPSAEQVLWCSSGAHEWTRVPQRGRPPRACPEHPPVPAA
jgi:DNA polymerase-3 subunit epsilon